MGWEKGWSCAGTITAILSRDTAKRSRVPRIGLARCQVPFPATRLTA